MVVSEARFATGEAETAAAAMAAVAKRCLGLVFIVKGVCVCV